MSTTIRGFFSPALKLAAVLFAVAGLFIAGAPANAQVPAPVAAKPHTGGSQSSHHSEGHHGHHSTHGHAHHTHHGHPHHAAVSRGERVVRAAAAQAGKPYVYGAAGPGAFDCSGLTSFVYRVAAHKYLPHSSAAQQGFTRRVSAGAAQRGDLVFFHDGGGVYHVAIYAGDHMVWHAPYTGARVRKERIWTSAVTYGHVR